MNKISQTMQVAFTYIGTIVGAGFATGQEIVQFYTRYGAMAAWTIALATALFIWIGTKILMMAADIGAVSYEDLNRILFGKNVGALVSAVTMVMLFGITTVMLAGAGSLFEEHLQLPYQIGLLVTLGLAYSVLTRGMQAILSVNSLVVPVMLAFAGSIVWSAMHSPGAGNWLRLTSDYSTIRIWSSPLLYVAFNLAMAQAVLVPMGATIRDKIVLRWGGILGGVGIGLLLFACHFALSAQMPGVMQFEIPMGHLTSGFGGLMQLLYVMVIFGEIFTTFVANGYGLIVQIKQRTGFSQRMLVIVVLIGSFIISQIGFSKLLGTLYPLFGLLSILWFAALIGRRSPVFINKS